MPRFLLLSALSLCLVFIFNATGCATSSGPQHTKQASTQTLQGHDASVQVKGLSCPQCAHTIKIIMDDDDAIQSSTVDLNGGAVYIHFEQGQSLSADAIKTLVTDSGFTPGEVSFNDKGGR